MAAHIREIGEPAGGRGHHIQQVAPHLAARMARARDLELPAAAGNRRRQGAMDLPRQVDFRMQTEIAPPFGADEQQHDDIAGDNRRRGDQRRRRHVRTGMNLHPRLEQGVGERPNHEQQQAQRHDPAESSARSQERVGGADRAADGAAGQGPGQARGIADQPDAAEQEEYAQEKQRIRLRRKGRPEAQVAGVAFSPSHAPIMAQPGPNRAALAPDQCGSRGARAGSRPTPPAPARPAARRPASAGRGR